MHERVWPAPVNLEPDAYFRSCGLPISVDRRWRYRRAWTTVSDNRGRHFTLIVRIDDSARNYRLAQHFINLPLQWSYELQCSVLLATSLQCDIIHLLEDNWTRSSSFSLVLKTTLTHPAPSASWQAQ